jgi:hypothetical protein
MSANSAVSVLRSPSTASAKEIASVINPKLFERRNPMKSLIASPFALAFVVSAGAASAQITACVNNSSGELKVATCSTSVQ